MRVTRLRQRFALHWRRLVVTLIAVTLIAVVQAAPLLMDDSVVFIGRVQKGADGATSFDMNGVQIKATVTGTTGLYASMSGMCAEGNTFQVFLDGVIQPKSRFNTSAWKAGEVIKVPLFPTGTLSADTTHVVMIVKDTEPQFAGTRVKPNYVTFHGFSGESSAARLVAPARQSGPQQHKVEFLGDSITAGFDNQCDIPGSPKGFPWSESFTKSWATGICNALDAECHYNAWSGFGMVANCCGGSTLGSDVWTRTIATVGSTNISDPHGTTAANEWDFSKWKADVVVINLGTNDHLGTKPTPKSAAFSNRYVKLVMAASKAYGKKTGFFLACGPMSSDYCPEVKAVIQTVTASGVKAFLLNQVGFEDGKYGKKCAVSLLFIFVFHGVHRDCT